MDQDTKICWQCRTDVPFQASMCPNCRARLGAKTKSGIAAKRMGWLGCTGIGCGTLILLSMVPIVAGTFSAANRVRSTRAQALAEKPAEPVDIPKTEAKFKAILPLFTKVVDKFDHSVTWRHKAFSQYINGNGTTLAAEIRNSHLES